MEILKSDLISLLNEFEIRCIGNDFKNYSFGSNDSEAIQENAFYDVLHYICECISKGDFKSVLQKRFVDYGFLSSLIDVNNTKEIVKYMLGSCDDNAYQIKEFTLLFIAIASLQEFIRCNFCGPRQEIKSQYSLVSELIPESAYSDSDIAMQFSLDGETVYQHVLHPKLLYLSRILLENITCKEILTRKWWLLRSTFLHQTILPERNESLHNLVVSLINDVYNMDWITSENHISEKLMFVTESCHIFLYYGEVVQARRYVNEAQSITGLEIELSGAMGKRTQHQQKPTAQLFVKLKRNHENFQGTVPEKNDAFPADIHLQDDTLLDEISFISNEHNLQNLFAEEQLVLLSYICLVKRSGSFDDLLKEELMSYIDCLLAQPRIWSVYLKALIMRCKNEKNSHRRMDRAVRQMEAIVESVKKELPPFSERQKYFYSTSFPAYWILEKDLADLLLTLCCTKSALDIYERLELWEDIVECYIRLGRTHSAEKVIREQLEKGETPMLWCLLGDVTENIEFYLKAWELSNHRSARAQRSLGYYHYRKKEYQECISPFLVSLEINHLQPQVWFSVGHAATQIENYELAARAYRQVVMFDEDSFEAWNNLANAYIKTKQKERAWRSLDNALKCNHEEWRVWENYLLVSTDIGAFDDAIRAWHRLFDIKGKHGDTLLLDILINAIVKDLPDIRNLPSSRLKKKALQLLGRVTSVITNDPKIWELYSLLINSDSERTQTEDLEKAVLYQQKALRCYNQKGQWERNFNACKEVLLCSVKLAEQSLTFIKLLEKVRQIQYKTSAKLNLQSTITRGKKYLEDFPVDEKNELNDLLESLNNTLNEILNL